MKTLRFIIHFPALMLIGILGMIAALIGWEAAENWLADQFQSTRAKISL